MGIIAIYYGSSVTEVTTIASQSHVEGVVLNSTNGPWKSDGTVDSNVASMVTAVIGQQKQVYGYVDTGGTNYGASTWTATGSSCVSGTHASSIVVTNPTTGVWAHWAYDSSEFNLGTTPATYAHCYLDYDPTNSTNGSLRVQIAQAARTSGTFTCATVLGYIKDQVDQWLDFTNGYGATGIWFDNAYVGSINDATNGYGPSNDNRYIWYKKLCDYVWNTYNGLTILNAGSSYGSEYWHNGGVTGGSPFFTYMNVQETIYNGGNTNFPGGSVSPGNTIPSYISASGHPYSGQLLAILKSASGISSANVTAWYSDACSKGIGNAYISTTSGGGFGLPGGNATISAQNTASGASGC